MASFAVFLFCSFAFVFLQISNAQENKPEQIHIAFTGVSSERLVSYVTPSPYVRPVTVAVYGKNPAELNQKATGESFVFGTDGHNFTIHNVKLTGLDVNTRYYYKVGDLQDNGFSDVMSFSTKDGNLVFALYGDMGYTNSVSLKRLIKEVDSESYDAVIHLGDFAYDLYEEKGDIGDEFMNAIQPISSKVPYMALPGNHEYKYNFTHFRHRFYNMELGVGQSSGSGTSLWYSFDMGLIHFVAFDTEVYYYYSNEGQIQRQLQWLEEDLIKANKNRDKRPWIISLAHKAFFMEKTNFTSFLPLLHKYGVDLHFCGHAHNYQRLYPTYNYKVDKQKQNHVYINPAYMTTIVAGSAGSKEELSHGSAPEEDLAKYIVEYGYGHLQVMNKTHLYWTWENTHEHIRPVMQDYLWVVQEHHGMRDVTDNQDHSENRPFGASKDSTQV